MSFAGDRDLASIFEAAQAQYRRTALVWHDRGAASVFLQRDGGEARVASGIGAAPAHAEAFGPDLVVNDVWDFIGPLVGAVRGIPNDTVESVWRRGRTAEPGR